MALITPGRRTVRALAAAAALFAALPLSGCGAGQTAQTSREVAAIPGQDADAGSIELRDLIIPYRDGGYPAGSDVPMVVHLFSEAEQPVTLSRVEPGAAGNLTVQARTITLHPAGTSSGTALTIPAEGELFLVPGSGPYLVAEHIDAPLPYAASVPVRFTFSTGDSVNVDVPMAPPAYPVTGSPASPAAP